MAPAEDGAAAPVGRRGGRRLWATVLCFGSSRRARGEEALAAGRPWAAGLLPRRKRTVPVDGGELAARPGDCGEAMRGAGEGETRKGPRARVCCFLPPARAQDRKRSATMESSMNHKQRQQEHAKQQPARPQGDKNPTSEAPAPSAPAPRLPATGGNNGSRAARPRAAPTETPPPAPAQRDAAGEDGAPARESRTTKASAAAGGHGEKAGVGAFGPAVGLSVVTAVSMAGLLGGRLWAVACVCAWLAALSRLQRRLAPVAAAGGTAGSNGGKEVVADVDSRDHKKLVVLRGLLERDRIKAATA